MVGVGMRPEQRVMEANVAGDAYPFRTILNHRHVEGQLQFLLDWEPLWQPAGNVPRDAAHDYFANQVI